MTGNVRHNESSIRHTPYDGSHPPFRIGLQPLDLRNWIEVDDRLDFYLSEKERLWALHPGKTFVAEPDTVAVQTEILDLIAAHVARRFPDIYRRDADRMFVNGRTVDLAADEPALLTAARLVPEDLLVMRRDETGWRLVAGSLSFPTGWSLTEKFGRPMEQIHGPVPGFGEGTRNAAMINRIFDSLQVAQPVWRMNWSIYSNDALYQGDHHAEHVRRMEAGLAAFLRVEYQTLRKLPVSCDILFTVRIHIDPIALLERHPDCGHICSEFIRLLQAMDREQLEYKGMIGQRDLLISRLQAMSGSNHTRGTVS
ncbi:MAG: DUF3445 domain-containing protein [Rhizobiaceae bacterium]